MSKRIFISLVVLILNFTVLAFAQTKPLDIPGLEELALPVEMAARVSKVFPSKPGDTFVQLRNGMTVLIRENHASQVVSAQILVKVYAEDDTTNVVSGVKVAFTANQAGTKLAISIQNDLRNS